MEVVKNKYSVVILSHSSYSDVWPILEQSYLKYFNHTDFDLYIATDQPPLVKNGLFNFIVYPDKLKWGGALQYVCSQLEYSKVIFTFDDLILTKPINKGILDESIKDSETDYCKLIVSHVRFYERFLKSGNTFTLSVSDSYRGSLVFALVNAKFLDFLTKAPISDFSPWHYERNINSLISEEIKMKGSRYNVFKFNNLIIKGLLNPVEKWLCNIRTDFRYEGNRSNMSIKQLANFYIKLISFTVVKYVTPYSVFQRIRNLKQNVLKLK